MAAPFARPMSRKPRTNKASSSFLSYRRLVAISLSALLVGFVVYMHPTSMASAVSVRSPGTAEGSPPVFSLLVTVNFETSEYKEQFLKDIQPLAEYVKSSEPDTVAYEVLLSDKDPLEVLILERYRDKENAYLKVHKSSGPFLAFRPKLLAMQEKGHAKINGISYLDSGVGFGDRTRQAP